MEQDKPRKARPGAKAAGAKKRAAKPWPGPSAAAQARPAYAGPMSGKSVIAIIGPDHGGSTMVAAMLASSPEWKRHPHLGEFHALYLPKPIPLRCSQDELPCPIWKDFPTDNASPHLQFMELHGVDRVIDSSKRPDWFERIPPNVSTRVVYVWRDPESIRHSYHTRFTGLQAELKYVAQIKKMQRDLQWLDARGEKFVAVSLESLLRAPQQGMEKLCRALELDYFPGKEEFWRFEHHHLGGARRVKEAFRHPESARLIPPSGEESSIQAELKDVIRRQAGIMV